MNTSVRTAPARPPAATAVGLLALIGVAGAAFMSLAHLDVALPFVEVGGVVAPVAIGLGFGALLYAVVAYGAFTRKPWTWPVALIVNGIALATTLAPPQRGGFEYVALAVSLVAVGVLVSRSGREALLRGDQRPSSRRR